MKTQKELKKYNSHINDCFDLIHNEVWENFKDKNNDMDHDLHGKILKDTITSLYFKINK